MFAGETWQHERYTGVDRDDLGNPVDTWAAPVAVPGCDFAPNGMAELVDGQRVVSTPALYVPKPITITSRDRFTGRGKTYEVEGDDIDWAAPWDPTVIVNLRRVTSL
jgi:hypothetical protein